ncbi:MAG: hypothetical protein ACI9BW_000704 [Gammaproteobacteria bacterium]|jgi:hypothetical protein
MSRFKRRSFNAMSLLALSCLLLRSLVAPGLMLVSDSTVAGNLILVLCPAQNRSIDFERLSPRDARNDHAKHIGQEGESPARSAHDHDGSLHAESLDTGCGLWSGSAAASLVPEPLNTISFAVVDSWIPTPPVYFSTSRLSPSQPRAPPIV